MSVAANAADDPIEHPAVSFDVHCESSAPALVPSFDTVSNLVLTAPTKVESGELVGVTMAPSLDRETEVPPILENGLAPGDVVATITIDVVQDGVTTSTFEGVGANTETLLPGEIVAVEQAEGEFTAPTELGEFDLVAKGSVITVLGSIHLTCEGSNPEDDPTITTLEVVDPNVGDDDGADDGTDNGDDDGKDDGTDNGDDDGKDDGTDNGDDDGKDDGKDDGTDKGDETGKDDGTDKGDDKGVGGDDGKDDGEPLPDTGMSPMGMILGLLLIGSAGVVLLARRRMATDS